VNACIHLNINILLEEIKVVQHPIYSTAEQQQPVTTFFEAYITAFSTLAH